jgi:hypothetical protein
VHQHVTRRLSAARLVAAALLCVAAGGCKPHANGASVTCAPPECPADSTLLLVAEVDPPSDSQLVRQEFSSVTLDAATGLFVLALDAQVTLTGTVQIGAGATAKPVAATVVATRPSRIVGRPDVVYQATVDPTNGSYTLVVSRSLDGAEKYAVRVTTTDLSLSPPKTMLVAADSDKRVDVTFDPPLGLPELHGTILDSLQQPVPGMQVQATSVPADANAVALVSTTTVTDASGAFSLRLAASPPAQVLLTATPTMLADDGLPSLLRTVDTTKLGPTNAMTANLTMPPLPATALVSYKIVGTGTSGAMMPVTSATCVFSADVSDPHAADGTVATYRTSAMTDLSGEVDVELIPTESGNRTYDVTVTPDATQPFATRTTTVNVAPQGGFGPAIELSLRSQLSGRVLDPDGKPLHSLMVVPAPSTLATALGPQPLAAATTPQQATAGSDGSFSLRLDGGLWDVGLIPPADSMLPRLWLTELDLTSDLDVGAVTIPRGVMVHGVVHDPSGAPLAHAAVRLYTMASGNSACRPDDAACLAPPRLRAEASSGSDGVVALILPSQPQP